MTTRARDATSASESGSVESARSSSTFPADGAIASSRRRRASSLSGLRPASAQRRPAGAWRARDSAVSDPVKPVAPNRTRSSSRCASGAGMRPMLADRLTTYPRCMCRNIRPLNNFEPPATRDEVTAAALQYVRKVSGTTKPSQANQDAFDRAVREIAHVTEHLLDDLVTTAPPKDREVEADKARARAALRYAR